jgi:exodeoxyribonuclease VII large subunit
MQQQEAGLSVYSVSELTREIKYLLETSIPTVWLQGEVSNFVHHSSGHMYFSVKDNDSQIACVMWRSRNMALTFAPKDGMTVLAQGQVRVYEKRGNYQFDIVRMVPAGIGALQMAFEQLKARLQAEGLFDPDHKRPIPPFPQSVGIVTSPTGAAIRDIVQIIRRRMPSTELVLRPTLVQGEGAAQDIVSAIEELNLFGGVQVLIVGRGGGSLEDLQAFNDERVARAIYNSAIPVVSAVGHEIDFTIADFVADLRAPTPSAAAELVTPERQLLLETVHDLAERCTVSLSRTCAYYRERLQQLRSHYGLRRPGDVVLQKRQRLDELHHIMHLAMQNRLQSDKQRLQHMQHMLFSLGPESVLKRGYALCFRLADGSLVTSVQEARLGDDMIVKMFDGHWQGKVEKLNPEDSAR